jgi:hypothetical protein
LAHIYCIKNAQRWAGANNDPWLSEKMLALSLYPFHIYNLHITFNLKRNILLQIQIKKQHTILEGNFLKYSEGAGKITLRQTFGKKW